MVDSLNVVIDQDQRSRQRPVWTTDVAGKVFGIDSQYIHVAGIKIPTAALALLPISLPQGNYDEQLRARQLDEMRRSEEHTSELQSRPHLVCRLLLENKKTKTIHVTSCGVIVPN